MNENTASGGRPDRLSAPKDFPPLARARPVLYRFCLDDEETLLPDRAFRFQPEGPDDPSEVIDPNSSDVASRTPHSSGGLAARNLIVSSSIL